MLVATSLILMYTVIMANGRKPKTSEEKYIRIPVTLPPNIFKALNLYLRQNKLYRQRSAIISQAIEERLQREGYNV